MDFLQPNICRKVTILFLAVITILRIIYSGLINLVPDEAYYWEWSRYPALSYYDHPPIVSYLIRLTTGLLGVNEMGVKFGSILLALGSSILIYLLVRDIFKSEISALFSIILTNSILLYSIGAIVITPDSPQGFFWILAIYFLMKIFMENRDKLWYLAGVSLGLGILSKYTAILIVPCIFIYLIFSDKNRYWLFKIKPYISLIIAAIIFSPVLIWNSENNWISLKFQLKHGLSIKQEAGFVTTGDFLLSQIGLLTPLVFILIIIGFILLGYRGFIKKDDCYLYLFSVSFPVFIFFIFASYISKMEGNWAAVGYIGAVIGIAGIFGEIAIKDKNIFRLFIFVLLSAIIITALVHLQALYPIVPVPKDLDRTNELYGWKELGKEVLQLVNDMDNKNRIFIMGKSHQISSELSFYTGGKIPVFPERLINKGSRLSQYDFWYDVNKFIHWNSIYVTDKEDNIKSEIEPYFSKIERIKPFSIIRNDKEIKVFYLYKCYDYTQGVK